MPDIADRMLALRQYIDADIAAAIESLVKSAPDARLNRINPIAFAAARGIDAQETIAAFLHGTRLGLFELSWNVICSSCGGVLHSASSLRSIHQEQYRCALCARDCEPNLEEAVEITFTVDARLRRISAHDPDSLPLWDYLRQIFWSSGSDLPDDPRAVAGAAVADAIEIPAAGQVLRHLHLEGGLAILFDPVTHSSRFLEIEGPPAASPQSLAVRIDDARAPGPVLRISPGPLDLTLENGTARRVLPILWIAGDALKKLVQRRIPVLTAKRLLTNQTFRDLYGTNVLDANQRFRITSLTFLFTDLKGSTALYEEIGDLAAYDLIRFHFQIALETVSHHGGAVVKTIGDAVMATFPTAAQGVAAALDIRQAIATLNRRDSRQDLALKIGLHTGPCLAVLMNERQDYFGQTVNIAARVQSTATPEFILATPPVMEDADVRALVERTGLGVRSFRTLLRGIHDEMQVFGIEA